MSNIGPADPDKIKLLRSIVINTPMDITPDMVVNGIIAYQNFQAALGKPTLDRPEHMVRAILEAALGGGD